MIKFNALIVILRRLEKVKKEILISIVGLLALSVIVVPVMAETAAMKQSLSATATISGTPDPGKSWITEDGIMQIKKMRQVGSISGDIDGTIELVISLTNDLTTMKGSGHGKFTIATTDGTIKGTLRVEVDFARNYALGTFVGKETTGNYDGKKIMGSLESLEPGVLDFDGIILTPHS